MNQWLERSYRLDQDDPLRSFRDEFWIPSHTDGTDQVYMCGNSLGLQPRRLQQVIADELDAWKTLAVEGHFEGTRPWMPYHELLREPLANLVGALPREVVAMNSLTVNLHLMMVSFYRPDGQRRKILIERQPFPSDRYAVESQIRFHGLDPDQCLVELGAEADDWRIGESLIEDYLEQYGDEVALVLWPGVHYVSGQLFDLARISQAAHRAGARVGFDLAHAAGNVPLSLHESGPDFAVWCSYKYLNAGAGAVGACFVHERHHKQHENGGALPRFHGWWGVDPATRFEMGPVFNPAGGADVWQLSNPPILAMAPLWASLQIFEQAGLIRLRAKSIKLTAWLERLIHAELDPVLEIITPSDPQRRGCQLSLRVRAGREQGRRLFEFLQQHGVISDWREPDVIRVAPVPLYNRFEDCARMVTHILAFESIT